MKSNIRNNIRSHPETYSYDLEPAINHGKRAVKILVKDGWFAGKSAFIITMPDSVSGFFPEVGVPSRLNKPIRKSITKP